MNVMEKLHGARRFSRRRLVAGMLPACLFAAREARVVKHIGIYREKGRFGGWPANHGIWSWGNEILVGFSAAYFKKREWMYHQADPEKPEAPAFARSRDGGETWSVWEAPEQMLPRWGGRSGRAPDERMDFSASGFAMTLRFNNNHAGPTVFWYSLDKGERWRGPFEFPSLGLRGIAGRTDYLVFGRHEAMHFLTEAKRDNREGRPFCARTRNGGLSWEFVSYIGPEPAGFAIMPSTLALTDGTLLTAIRRREARSATAGQRDWLDTYISANQGKSWTMLAPAVEDTGRGGNPAALVRLPDGRLCLNYGYRSEPYTMRARLSTDGGRTWGRDILLREGGKAPDLGYPRSVVRPDGKIVTVYYFNDDVHNERFIEAVIWDPGSGTDG
jgi:hypothetical protein